MVIFLNFKTKSEDILCMTKLLAEHRFLFSGLALPMLYKNRADIFVIGNIILNVIMY